MTTQRVARNALDRALDETEDLLLVYQPIHQAQSGAIYAAEALMRQRRENGELRETSIITETAERGPELFLLDSLIFRTAFTDTARWMEKTSGVRLHVNLSPREFEEGNIVEKLQNLVTDSRTDMTRINLEITETSYIERPEETIQVLEELKTLGVELWLDDFGTGHSSITHLQRFPLDGLKIPKEFLADDERSRSITRALIALAHELGLSVIAEGVEDGAQLEFLLECGCDYVQGFLFSYPMPLSEWEKLLSN